MSDLSQHGEWLSLLDVSGPFLAEPVLNQVFPQGLEQIDPLKRKSVRQAYEEWREAIDLDDPNLTAFHKAWIDLVIKQVLELDEADDEDILKPQEKLSDTMSHVIPEHGITLSPDYSVVDEQNDNRPLLLVQIYPPESSLDEPVKGDGWATSPAERMITLCRANDVRLGLVTNGEQWMLVDAPVGAVSTFASWYARLWVQEPITLQAFVNLLGIRRFFVDRSEQLPALLDESLKLQDEVTDALGEQVRRAVEVLIQRLDRADVDLNRELLVDVDPSELYEAALTVMMRIVFLLSAEERGLLLMGDERYEANYAVSTLRMQLRGESEEILERRQDAWSRLLSIFRAVYGGIQHETMRLPALGGSLFDPDRFPFLEGRAKETTWRTDTAKPLPIDNRTVLLLLDAVQLFQGRTLSYRALDVEQIGYVYEGLLERTVIRASEVTLDLDAAKKSKKPWVTLDELEIAAGEGDDAVAALLQERTGSLASRVKRDLARKLDESAADKLLTACHGDQALRNRIKPYFYFLRMDRWGYPLVYPEKTFMVTTGVDRRETGTHYTPKSLTEAIVKETLEPIVYVGPAEGIPREKWTLKTPAELLELKICDPAMGSGAFLVQVCRWLAERLVEAWEDAENQGKAVTSEGVVVEKRNGHEPLRNDAEERLLTARRLIAERCLYGVDVNPLAVELAKLAIWLVTLAKGRPFGFLDHNLRSGDSLLGISDLEQLYYLDMNPGKGSSKKLFASKINQIVEEAIKLRSEIRSRPIRDIRDIEVMARLDQKARRTLELPETIADALLGEILSADGKRFDATELSIESGGAMNGEDEKAHALTRRASKGLSVDLPRGKPPRRPFHWPLEFPEVFCHSKRGFDAIVGNPPFMAGRKMRRSFGDGFLGWLQLAWPHCSLNADLCTFFFLRSAALLHGQGSFGLLATKTVAQGDSARTSLLFMEQAFQTTIRYARSSFVWPGSAAVVTALVVVTKGSWQGSRILDGELVGYISPVLDKEKGWGEAHVLIENKKINYQGSVLAGTGFVLTNKEAKEYFQKRKENKEVVHPYLSGDDINSHPAHLASRWAIDFRDYDYGYCGDRWPELFDRVVRLVKPKRDKAKRKAHKKYWWHHGDKRPALYSAIKDKENVFAISRHTKYVAIAQVSTHQVFQESVCILDLPSWGAFAVLQSSFHDIWVRRGSSTLGATLRYTPSDYFDTFPFLHLKLKELTNIGERYCSLRTEILCDEGIGLTKLYNLFHDPEVTNSRVLKLRDLHRQMDMAVAHAYEWDDLSLDHSFYEVNYLPENDRVRFTISEPARIEALRRLSALNREKYESEQLVNRLKAAKKGQAQQRSLTRKSRMSAKKLSSQAELFQADDSMSGTAPKPVDAVERLYEWIEERRETWTSKKAILTATGIDDLTLDRAIAELIAEGDLEQQGVGDEARYRAKG